MPFFNNSMHLKFRSLRKGKTYVFRAYNKTAYLMEASRFVEYNLITALK